MNSLKSRQHTLTQNATEESELHHSRTEGAAFPSSANLPGQAMALLRAPLAGAQRRAMVANLGQQYGNRQVQRIVNSLRNPIGGVPFNPEEESNQPIGGQTATIERMCSDCAEEQETKKESATGGLPSATLSRAQTSTRPRLISELARTFVPDTNAIAGTQVQRTIGDGHDLTSQRFSGDAVLEAVFDPGDNRLLRRGNNGNAFTGISSIQLALQDLGHTVPGFGPDGRFGAETEKALKAFQRSEGITADGIVGPITMGRLDQRAPNGTPPTPPAPAASPTTPPTINDVITGGPSFTNCGHFHLRIRWNHNARNGFIIQEITNAYAAQNANNSVNNDVRPTPHYFEAWQVDNAGAITEGSVMPGTHDWWIRPRNPGAGGRGTKGNWSMNANVFFAPTLDPAAAFAVGNVLDAGGLRSTVTRPTNLTPVISTRRHAGIWDCTNGRTTHNPA